MTPTMSIRLFNIGFIILYVLLSLDMCLANNSEEAILMEREAFTYSKVEGAAIKLLDKFCF